MILVTIPGPLLKFIAGADPFAVVVDRVILTVAYHVQAVEATDGANQNTRMCCNYHGCRIAGPRFGLEHPRPYALGSHRLPSAEPKDSPGYREGKCGAGETS